jgi:hypothetical protein
VSREKLEKFLALATGIGGLAVGWFPPTKWIEGLPEWSRETIGWIGLALVLIAILAYIFPDIAAKYLWGKRVKDEKPGEIPDTISAKNNPPQRGGLTLVKLKNCDDVNIGNVITRGPIPITAIDAENTTNLRVGEIDSDHDGSKR